MKLNNRRGATGQQYAIIVGLVGVVALSATSFLGGSVKQMFANTSNVMGGASNGIGVSGGGGSPPPPPPPAGPDYTPDPFTFTGSANLDPSTNLASNIVQVTGFEPTTASVTGPAGTVFRICANSDCSTEIYAYGDTPQPIEAGQYVQMVSYASASPDTTVTATLTIGAGSGSWSIATTNPCPNPNSGYYSMGVYASSKTVNVQTGNSSPVRIVLMSYASSQLIVTGATSRVVYSAHKSYAAASNTVGVSGTLRYQYSPPIADQIGCGDLGGWYTPASVDRRAYGACAFGVNASQVCDLGFGSNTVQIP